MKLRRRQLTLAVSLAVTVGACATGQPRTRPLATTPITTHIATCSRDRLLRMPVFIEPGFAGTTPLC